MVRHRETICPIRSESRCDRESKLQGVLGDWRTATHIGEPSHFQWTPQTRGTLRSDDENFSSGKSRDLALAGGGEGFFPGHLENVPKFQNLSPMCPNTCVTYVVGMDRE